MNDMNVACFLCVVRTRNFSETARKFSITQQAVSRNIQKLESELGHSLLSRSGQGVELTYAGKLFYRWFLELESSMSRISSGMGSDRLDSGGHLRVGWSELSGCPPKLEKLLKAFSAENPALDMEYRQGPLKDIVKALTLGDIDVAILPRHTAISGAAVSGPIFSEPLFCCVRACAPYAGQPAETLLSSMPNLTSGSDSDGDGYSSCYSVGFPGDNTVVLPNLGSVCAEVLYGGGVAVLPEHAWPCGREGLLLCPIEGAYLELSSVRMESGGNQWAIRFDAFLHESAVKNE